MFTPVSELPGCIVPRLPKQNRQMEEEPLQLPIRSRGKRACGASARSAEFSGRTIASFQGNRSHIPLACTGTFPRR